MGRIRGFHSHRDAHSASGRLDGTAGGVCVRGKAAKINPTYSLWVYDGGDYYCYFNSWFFLKFNFRNFLKFNFRMHKKLVVGNLKMNPVSLVEFERYLDMIEKETRGRDFSRTEIVICPPPVFLQRLLDRKFKNVKAGAQNIFWEPRGAFTGEISAVGGRGIGAGAGLA